MNLQQKITAGDAMPSDHEIDVSMFPRLRHHSSKAMMLLYAAQKLAPGSPDDMTLPAVLEAAELQLNNVLDWTRSRADHYAQLRREVAKMPAPVAAPKTMRLVQAEPAPDYAHMSINPDTIDGLHDQTLGNMNALLGGQGPDDHLYVASVKALEVWVHCMLAWNRAGDFGTAAAEHDIEQAEQELEYCRAAITRFKEECAPKKGRRRAAKPAKKLRLERMDGAPAPAVADAGADFRI